MEAVNTNSLEHRYTLMQSDREPFLKRARTAAVYTLPFLVPPQGYTGFTELPTPYQSDGARGVNNLASKLLLALFPPNAPFFKHVVNPYAAEAIANVPDAMDEIEKSLLKVDEAIQVELERACLRPYLHETMKHLVVAGNAIFYIGDGKKRKPTVYHLQDYVVHRCADVVECIIIQEMVDRDDLPQSITQTDGTQSDQPPAGQPAKVGLYTGCVYDEEEDTWEVWQEALGKELPKSRGSFKGENFPYIVLRGEVVSGDDYGRGYVEQYLGDIMSLEGLSQAIVEGAAASAHGKYLVNPNGVTNLDDLAKSGNWEYVPGRADDVTTLQANKFSDFQVTGSTAEKIREALAYAFLLNSAVQRNAERVTAEEIRTMIQELEQALGGIYTLLSHEFQLPLVSLLAARLRKRGELPKFNKRAVRPQIVTGIEALGRGNDLNRLMTAGTVLKGLVGDQVAASVLDPTVAAKRVLTGAGVRDDGLVKDPERIAQEQQQSQMSEAMMRAAPNLVNTAGGMIQQAMAPQQQS